MRFLATLAVLALGILGACTFIWPRAIVHARITVEVETPEGLKTGSAVNQLGYSLEPAIGTTGLNVGMRHGEAVAVDLGSRGVLYALLTGRSPRTGEPDQGYTQAGMYMKLVAKATYQGAGDRAFIYAVRAANGKAELPAQLIPFMVRFRDEKDPKTVEAVDPENLAASFGPGVRLKRVTIETVAGGVFPFNMFGITGEPLTSGIEKRLGWLPALNGGYLDGAFASSHKELSNTLHGGEFKRGQ
jgi:hypothetical protein